MSSLLKKSVSKELNRNLASGSVTFDLSARAALRSYAYAKMQRLGFAVLVVLAGLLGQWPRAGAQTYVLDDSVGLGRQFDGIGGLSGGGVSLGRHLLFEWK